MRLDSEGPQLSRESFGVFLCGSEFARDRVSFQGKFRVGKESLTFRIDENELPLRAIEAHSETGTDPPVHLEDLLEFLSGAFPPIQLKGLGVINIVFLDPITLVEVELLDHLLIAISVPG